MYFSEFSEWKGKPWSSFLVFSIWTQTIPRHSTRYHFPTQTRRRFFTLPSDSATSFSYLGGNHWSWFKQIRIENQLWNICVILKIIHYYNNTLYIIWIIQSVIFMFLYEIYLFYELILSYWQRFLYLSIY